MLLTDMPSPSIAESGTWWTVLEVSWGALSASVFPSLLGLPPPTAPDMFCDPSV